MNEDTLNHSKTSKSGNSAENGKTAFSGSILEEVMATKKEESLASFDPGKVIFDILEQFPERARHIVVKRYGLDGKPPETLEKLGEQYQITRERIRQIESQARKSLSAQAEGDIFGPVQKLLANIILEHGEAILEKKLLDELLGSQQTSSVAQNSLRLILTALPDFEPIAEDKYLNNAWTNNSHVVERIKKLADNVESIFEKENKVLRFKDLYEKIMESEYGAVNSTSLDKKTVRSYLEISKKISKNPYGEWGITDWNLITPRGVKDKAYLVLKKTKEPMHFKKISEEINRRGFPGRRAYPQTVHNELIKDQRFVLVGRGMYALKEWGYEAGTVADILEKIIKETEEPVEREELMEKVLKQRFVKRNTVLISLQNKERFQKVSKSKYTLVNS